MRLSTLQTVNDPSFAAGQRQGQLTVPRIVEPSTVSHGAAAQRISLLSAITAKNDASLAAGKTKVPAPTKAENIQVQFKNLSPVATQQTQSKSNEAPRIQSLSYQQVEAVPYPVPSNSVYSYEGYPNPCITGDQFYPAHPSLPRNFFIHCQFDIPHLKTCPVGTAWDHSVLTCNWY